MGSDRIYQLQNQLFSQLTRCATKHHMQSAVTIRFYAVEGACLELPGCTTQTLLIKSHSALSRFCVPFRILSCKYKNFGLILTQPVPYQYYSLHLESGLRLQTLIFTYLKERGITILCLFFRICSSRNQELQIAEQPRKQSSKTKEFSVILQQLLGLPQ